MSDALYTLTQNATTTTTTKNKNKKTLSPFISLKINTIKLKKDNEYVA